MNVWKCLWYCSPGVLTAMAVGEGSVLTPETAQSQVIPDQTLGAERSRVRRNTTVRGNPADLIEGGAIRGANIFHSFEDFDVRADQRVYFSNPDNIANILSRVTGSSRSDINGILGVDGNANLFLLNPNGIVFGPNAQLDVSGAFLASTGDRFTFSDGREFSARNPEMPPLVEVNIPIGVQFAPDAPAELTSDANLTTGGDLTLSGGTVTSTGLLTSEQGQVTVEGVSGDVRVQDVTAVSAQLSAHRDVRLTESNLITQGDLSLLAGNVVHIRDSVEEPFRAIAGGNLTIEGNAGIDILALNHPEPAFQSGGDLTLVSDGALSTDAHFTSGGNFSAQTLDGTPADLVSFYDPIILADGDVTFGSYTGVSLKVEATGSITATGDITIDTAECEMGTMGCAAGIPASDPDFATLTGQPALILRSGLPSVSSPNIPPDQTEGGATFSSSGSPSAPSNIEVQQLTIGNAMEPGRIILDANGATINLGGDIIAVSGGEIDLIGDVSVSGMGNVAIEGTTTFTQGSISGTITGGAGDDRFIFGNGSVLTDTATVRGEQGADHFTFGANSTIEGDIEGRQGGDTFTFLAGSIVNGTVTGGANDDTFILDGGNITTVVDAGTGNDTVQGTNGSDTLTISANNEGMISGIAFTDIETFDGRGGNDWVEGRSTDDAFSITGVNEGIVAGISFENVENLRGGEGDDIFTFANDTASISGSIEGGDGENDHIDYGGTTTNRIIALDNLSEIEQVTGGTGTDRVQGTSGNDVFEVTANHTATVDGVAFSNIEEFDAAGGNDTVSDDGDINVFTITSANAGEIANILFQDVENLEGRSQNDDFIFANDMASISGTIDGGNGGNDHIDYSPTLINRTIALNDLIDIERVTGGNGTDTVLGTTGDDTFDVTAANTASVSGINFSAIEAFDGDGGTDTVRDDGDINLFTLVGNNEGAIANIDVRNIEAFDGQTGTDLILGLSTNDIFTLTGTNAGQSSNIQFSNIDQFDGVGGNDTLIGSNGDEAFTLSLSNQVTSSGIDFSNIENINGADGNDIFTINNGVWNTLSGGNDNDTFTLNGGTVNTLFGNAGNDSFTLNGGSITTINGGANSDTLSGRNINELFRITGANQGEIADPLFPAIIFTSFSSVENLNGRGGDDTFLFSDNPASISGTIDGGVAFDDHIDYSGTSVSRTIDLDDLNGIERVTGSLVDDTIEGTSSGDTFVIDGANQGTVNTSLTFTSIENLDGEEGDDIFEFNNVFATLSGLIDGGSDNTDGDTIRGNSLNNSFDITGVDAGNVDGMAFAQVENLDGRDGNDTFTFQNNAASISGEITGGDGLDDHIDYSATTLDRTIILDDLMSIERVTGGNGTDTVQGTTGNDTLTVTAANAASVSGINFSAIEAFDGAAGTDTVEDGGNLNSFVVAGNQAGAIANIRSTNIEQFDGVLGFDIVTSLPTDDIFTITGMNAGISSGIQFINIDEFDGAGGTDIVQGLTIDDDIDLLSNESVSSSSIQFLDIEAFDGRGGIDEIQGLSLSNDLFTLTGNGAGQSLGIDFSNIEAFDGDSGTDTVEGLLTDDAITVTGLNEAESSDIQFSNIEQFDGRDGADTIFGLPSNEIFMISGGEAIATSSIAFFDIETVNGQDGTDTVVGLPTDDLVLLVASETADSSGIRFEDIERFNGNGGNDTVEGTGAADTFTLTGNQAGTILDIQLTQIDTFDGSGGANNVLGLLTDDIFTVTGNRAGVSSNIAFTNVDAFDGRDGTDRIHGENNADTFTITGDRSGIVAALEFNGIEQFDGRDGEDTVQGLTTADLFIISGTEAFQSSNIQFSDIENLDGRDGIDTLQGTAAADTFELILPDQGAIADMTFTNIENLQGVNGDDAFDFNSDDAIVTGTIDGGDGIDELDFSGTTGDRTILLSTLTTIERIRGGAGVETLIATDADEILLISGSDTASVSGISLIAVDVFDGSGGTDTVRDQGDINAFEITGDGEGAIATFRVRNIEAFDGEGGTDRIQGLPGAADIITLQGNNQVETSRIRFSNIEQFDGRGGLDRLEGLQTDDLVALRDIRSVDTSGIQFDNIEFFDGRGGIDTVVGLAGEDIFTLTAPQAVTSAGIAFSAIEALNGQTGNDILEGTLLSDEFIINGTNQGTVNGAIAFRAIETLRGLDGDDTFTLTSGTIDTLIGNSGNDSFTLTGGAVDTVAGNDGNDTFSFTAMALGTITGGAGDDTITFTTGTIDTVSGDDGNDSLTLAGGTIDQATGGDGDDTFNLDGSTITTVMGEGGNDTMTLAGGRVETIMGNEGGDRFILAGGSAGEIRGDENQDVLEGTRQGDEFTLSGNREGTVIPANGSSIRFSSIEQIDSGSGNDTLILNAGRINTLNAGPGNDTFWLNGGTASLDGNEGIDAINISAGAPTDDTIRITGRQRGRITNRTFDALGFTSVETLNSLGGDDQFVLRRGQIDRINAGDGTDTLQFAGGRLVDQIDGGTGDLMIEGNRFQFLNPNTPILGRDGTLTLRPLRGDRPILIAPNANPSQALTITFADQIPATFNAVVIGREDGTGAIDIRQATFRHPLTLYGGDVDITALTNAGNPVSVLASGTVTVESLNTQAEGDADGGSVVILGDAISIRGTGDRPTTSEFAGESQETLSSQATRPGDRTSPLDSQPGGINASATGTGQGGRIQIGDEATTSIEIVNSPIITTSPQNAAAGVQLTGDRITLDGGRILVMSGRNANLSEASVSLSTSGFTLQNESQIFVEGGTIDLTAVPQGTGVTPTGPDGSDIIARPNGEGDGGLIFLTPQSLFGFTVQEAIPGNRTNDIEGVVDETDAVVDLTEQLVELPTDIVDVTELVGEYCGVGQRNGSEITVAGRGGIPIQPTDLARAAFIESDWITLDVHPEEWPTVDWIDETAPALDANQRQALQTRCRALQTRN